MPYSDLLASDIEAMPKGYADDFSTLGEVASAGIVSNVADLPFFRDTSNAFHISHRNNSLKNLGVDVVELSSKNIQKPELSMMPDLSLIGLPNSTAEYAKAIEEESNRIADKAIEDARAANPASDIAYLKTTKEIRDLTVATRQSANLEYEKVARRAPSTAVRVGGALVGGIGAMTDPINALSMIVGAPAATGIIRGALIEGAINMGVEAFQTPENMKWAKEAGVQYGFGEAAMNIATAGIGAGVISGITRGVGRLLTKGKSMEVLDKIGHDKNIPSEVADAAKYQATVAHIDDSVPTLRDVVTDEEIVINRKNLQEVQDALIEGREPVIDESIFPNKIRDIENEITDIRDEIARLDMEQDATPSSLLPKELAGAKPRYGYKDKQFTLQFASDIDRAAYITAQTKKSPRDADYRKFLYEQGLSDNEINMLGSQIRNSIKAIAKDATPGKIEVPQTAQIATGAQMRGAVKAKAVERLNKSENLKMRLAEKEAALIQARAEQKPVGGKQIIQEGQKTEIGVTDAQSIERVTAHAERFDPEIPDRKTQPLEYIEKRVEKITDKTTNEAALADLDAKINEMPDMKIHMEDGTIKTLRELSKALEEDNDIMQSLTTCGLGK